MLIYELTGKLMTKMIIIWMTPMHDGDIKSDEDLGTKMILVNITK